MKSFFLRIVLLCSIVIILPAIATAQKSPVTLARVKYNGGGDWYNDPSGEVNLLKYIRANTNISVEPKYEYVDLSSDNLFLYPIPKF